MALDNVILKWIENNTVMKLDLCRHTIDDNDAKAIAKALKKNDVLTKLVLSDNKIGDEGIKALAEALKENKTLRELYISTYPPSKICTETGLAVAEMLKTNNSLAILHIQGYEIENAGFCALFKALENNNTLTSLCLTGNTILDLAENSANAIKELATNKNTLCLAKYPFSLGKETSIKKRVMDNRKLRLEQNKQKAESTLKEIKAPSKSNTPDVFTQIKNNIATLNQLIQRLGCDQKYLITEPLENIQEIKDDFQALHDRCVSEGYIQLARLCQEMKGDFQSTIDEVVEKIPETSPLFLFARFALFQVAFDGYKRDENYSYARAFVEALPLLEKRDGALEIYSVSSSSTEYEKSSEIIKAHREEQRVFDSVLLAIARQKMEPNEKIELTFNDRVNLLRFALLHYAKECCQEYLKENHPPKEPSTFFTPSLTASNKENLKRELEKLPETFDVKKQNLRDFKYIRKTLKKLLSEEESRKSEIKDNDPIEDLKSCYRLMKARIDEPEIIQSSHKAQYRW